MSTAAPPPVEQVPSGPTSGSSGQADRLIEERIVEACRALWWAELIRTVLKFVIATIGVLLIWVAVDQWVYSPGMMLRAVILLVLVFAAMWYLVTRVVPLFGRTVRPEYAARALERDFPELRQALTSYISLRDDRNGARLRHRVVRSIGAATAGHLKSHDELPSEAAGTFRWWIVTAILLAMLMAYAVVSPKSSLQSAARLAAPLASIDPAMRVSIADVRPGNAEAVAGRTIVVSAKVDGLRVDEEVLLRWHRAKFTEQTVLELDPETRRYVGELPLAHSDGGLIPYTVEAGDGIAGPFELTVQDVPVVAIQSVHYTPPEYTRHSPWTGSGGAIQALDGTQVKILAATNRPVVKAKIEFNPRPLGASIQATAGANEMEIESDGTSLSVAFPLRSARGRSAAVELDSYRISVWDSADQRNPEPIIYPIRAVADLPPEVAIMLPTRSPKDLPIDSQQVIEIHASDPDFGLQQISLEIRSGIDLVDQPILWSDEAGMKGNRIAEYRLRPSERGLRIGDTVNVIAVATDNRRLEHDRSVEPNTSRTDAIELKIVASQPPPRADDPEADGVSAPDDRPASDQSELESGSGNQEGGSGGEGQSQQQGGDQQQGDSQGGDQGDSQQGDTGDQENEPSGSGSNDPSDSGQSSASDPSRADPGSGEPSENQPGNGDTSAEPSGDQGSENQGTESQGTSGNNPPKPAGEAASSDGTSETESKQNRPDAGGRDQSEQPANENGDQSSARDAPQHDGEAFERIREHMEQQRQKQSRNEQQRGDPQGNQQSGNQSQTEKGQPDQQQPDQQQSGQQESGQQQADQQESGQQQAGGQTDDAQPPSEQGTEGQDRPQREGESGTAGETSEGGQPQPNQSGERDDQQSRDGGQSGESSEQQSGEQQSGEQQSGEQQSGEQTSGEQSDGRDSEGTDGDSAESAGEQPQGKPSEDGSSYPESSPAKSSDGSPSNASQGQQSGDQQTQSPANSSASGARPSESSNEAGTGGEGESQGGDSGLPPEAANAEYAKKATDMVLDYLQETRDKPDRELLDKLNWSEDDLKRFSDRWQKVRDIADRKADPKAKRELNEALKSLGMRPKPVDTNSNIRESADTLRSIRDSGNRKPPPAAYRDAFDAFRRAAGRKK